ncbi:acyl-coenzyme A thioesterase PaaI-like protein [Mycobacterium sp. OAS707]|uniref:PaaI family thioesterase n=1 Tax=Mycobacterium sp. OAS707 TaxID=2663822 RepID=UPI00178BE0D9|nr:PaaI family thioesterase [Mycobacterium sp. OAS707]MBE1551936.1 acyl-coenzyme A thioesterase PaaI-like protein [Mycobacterium sp. OAS707]
MREEAPVETLGRIHHDGPDDGLRAVQSFTGVVLCGSCQRLSRCRLGMRRETLGADGVVVSEIECPRDNEGGPNVAHGGWTAGILDEMVGHALLLQGEFVVTGTLQVKFVKPVPIERPLIGRAWEAGREGRRVFVHAEIVLAGTDVVVAAAEAIMVRRPADHFARHEKWLKSLNGEAR